MNQTLFVIIRRVATLADIIIKVIIVMGQNYEVLKISTLENPLAMCSILVFHLKLFLVK